MAVLTTTVKIKNPNIEPKQTQYIILPHEIQQNTIKKSRYLFVYLWIPRELIAQRVVGSLGRGQAAAHAAERSDVSALCFHLSEVKPEKIINILNL